MIEVAYWDLCNWLVTYLKVVHQKGELPLQKQVQLDIVVRVQLYVGKVLGIPLLITAYCDNSGVLGVVT